MRFFGKAMKTSGIPEKITMYKSGANNAAMNGIDASRLTLILVQ